MNVTTFPSLWAALILLAAAATLPAQEPPSPYGEFLGDLEALLERGGEPLHEFLPAPPAFPLPPSLPPEDRAFYEEYAGYYLLKEHASPDSLAPLLYALRPQREEWGDGYAIGAEESWRIAYREGDFFYETTFESVLVEDRVNLRPDFRDERVRVCGPGMEDTPFHRAARKKNAENRRCRDALPHDRASLLALKEPLFRILDALYRRDPAALAPYISPRKGLHFRFIDLAALGDFEKYRHSFAVYPEEVPARHSAMVDAMAFLSNLVQRKSFSLKNYRLYYNAFLSEDILPFTRRYGREGALLEFFDPQSLDYFSLALFKEADGYKLVQTVDALSSE